MSAITHDINCQLTGIRLASSLTSISDSLWFSSHVIRNGGCVLIWWHKLILLTSCTVLLKDAVTKSTSVLSWHVWVEEVRPVLCPEGFLQSLYWQYIQARRVLPPPLTNCSQISCVDQMGCYTERAWRDAEEEWSVPVSYTHLTLPTIYSV